MPGGPRVLLSKLVCECQALIAPSLLALKSSQRLSALRQLYLELPLLAHPRVHRRGQFGCVRSGLSALSDRCKSRKKHAQPLRKWMAVCLGLEERSNKKERGAHKQMCLTFIELLYAHSQVTPEL